MLSRIKIATDLLDEAYSSSHDSSEEQLDVIYKFLVSDQNDRSGIDEQVCLYYNLTDELLEAFKRDAWLIVLLDGYEYLRYLTSTASINEDEAQILTELDNLEFTFTNLLEFFSLEEHEEKIKNILRRYYERVSKGNKFEKICKNYNFKNPTPFRTALANYVENVEAMDFMCAIYDRLDDKYQTQINETLRGENEPGYDDEEIVDEEFDSNEEMFIDEDEFDEEGYQTAMDEMFAEDKEAVDQIMTTFKKDLYVKIAGFMKGYFDTQQELTNFVGFFMSFVYRTLLDNKKRGNLFKEEVSMLQLLEKTDLNLTLLAQTFCGGEEFVFVALDTFSKRYYEDRMTVLTMRDVTEDINEKKQIALLDEYYSNQVPVEEIKLISSPLYELYDMLFIKYKEDYPEDYIAKMYELLMSNSTFEPVFYELNIEGNLTYHRLLMIRYITRRFMEMIKIKQSVVTKEEMLAYIDLEATGFNLKSIVNNFSKNGLVILRGYDFNFSQTDVELKKCIRNLKSKADFRKILQVDPLIIGDSTYYRAIVDTNLYSYLESNGIEKTIQYLQKLAIDDYGVARTHINEMMVSIYSAAKEKTTLDSIEKTIVVMYEDNSSDVEFFVESALKEFAILYQVVSKYYENEKDQEFPIKFEDRVVKFPKVKQKLYPSSNE